MVPNPGDVVDNATPSRTRRDALRRHVWNVRSRSDWRGSRRRASAPRPDNTSIPPPENTPRVHRGGPTGW